MTVTEDGAEETYDEARNDRTIRKSDMNCAAALMPLDIPDP